VNEDLVPIGQLPARGAKLFGEKPALMRRKGKAPYEPVSFLELSEKVEKLADGLLTLGLSPGDRVGILGENRPEWAISYLAIHRAGGVTVPIDAHLKEQELRHILDDSEAKYVFVSPELLPDIQDLTSRLKALEKIICLETVSESGVETLDGLMKKGKGGSKPERGLDELAVILYTSGTTGFSKAVMLSHRNIVSNVSSMLEALSLSREDVFLGILPLHHTFGATVAFLVPLYWGCTVAFARSLKPREILEDIQDSKTSVILCVPQLYEMIHASIQRNLRAKPLLTRAAFKATQAVSQTVKILTGRNPSSLLFRSVRKKAGLDTIRYFVCGGAPLPPEVGRAFADLGFTFLQGYGLTESSPVLTVDRPGKSKPDSIGFPLPGVEIRLDNPDEHGVGELIARGPNIMMGYYKNSQATALALRDGWLYTGDLARKDKDGRYYIAGRTKNLIVSAAGKNIYPEEVEAQLLKSPFITEVMVIGVVNPETKREEVQAIIYPNSETLDVYAKEHNKTLTPEDIQLLIGEEVQKQCLGLADYKRVKKFQLREEEFPKTALKKIKRYLVMGGKPVAVKGGVEQGKEL